MATDIAYRKESKNMLGSQTHRKLTGKYRRLDDILDSNMLPKVKSYYRTASFVLKFYKSSIYDNTL